MCNPVHLRERTARFLVVLCVHVAETEHVIGVNVRRSNPGLHLLEIRNRFCWSPKLEQAQSAQLCGFTVFGIFLHRFGECIYCLHELTFAKVGNPEFVIYTLHCRLRNLQFVEVLYRIVQSSLVDESFRLIEDQAH